MRNIQELISSKIEQLSQSQNFGAKLRTSTFYFEAQKLSWINYKKFIGKKAPNYYEKLIRETRFKNFSLESYMRLFPENSLEHQEILLAALFIKHSDYKAPQKIGIEGYDSVNPSLRAGSPGVYYLSKWLKDLFEYKKNSGFKNISDDRLINLINFLDNPSSNLTMLLEVDREKCSLFFLNKKYDRNSFTKEIFEYFDAWRLEITNPENKGNIYTDIMYSLKDYWNPLLLKSLAIKRTHALIVELDSNINVWYYKPGEKEAHLWEECKKKKAMLFGFDETMDLLFKSQKHTYANIQKSVERVYKKPNNSRVAIINKFVNEIKANDIILVCKGNLNLIGIGKVKSSTLFTDGNRVDYKSYKKVDWTLDINDHKLLLSILDLSTKIIEHTVELYNKRDTLKILKYIVNQNPEVNLENNAEEQIEIAIENDLLKDRGLGFQLNSKLRKLIENYAMESAKQYLVKNKFEKIEDVSTRKSYDYECFKDEAKYQVEVKGTITDGKNIILTYREVELSRKYPHSTLLFILHSIKVQQDSEGDYMLSGGIEKVIHPFEIKINNLKPISYTYTVI